MRTHHLTLLLITGSALGLAAQAQQALPPLPTETDSNAPVQTTPGGAQVSFSQPTQAAPAPATPTPVAQQGNCKLMASNTVRVIYRGIVESGWGAAPAAHFIVIENLAHKSYAPEGDAALAPGTLVGVELRRDIPGQPASVVDSIMAMRPGEEALMRMDHLYMLDQASYGDLRVCGRFQARIAQPVSQTPTGALPYGLSRPAATPQQPAAPAPNTSTPAQPTTRTTTGASGEVSTKWEVDSQGHVRERIYVNGEEVQPPTLQTAAPSQPQPTADTTPAPAAPSPAVPDRVIPEDSSGDDTVIETPSHPAPQAAAQQASTATSGTPAATTGTPVPTVPTPAPSGSSSDYDPTKDSF